MELVRVRKLKIEAVKKVFDICCESRPGSSPKPSGNTPAFSKGSSMKSTKTSTILGIVFIALSFALISRGCSGYALFTYVGVILIACSRFYGLDHGVPCPELLFLIPIHFRERLFAFVPSAVIPSVDELLFNFSGNFGHLEMFVGKLLAVHPLWEFFGVVYWGIPLAGVLVYLSLPSATLRRKFIIVNMLSVLVFAFYRICPASGPSALIGDLFPNTIPNFLTPHTRIVPASLLNAMPSGHFTWAIVMFWFGRYCNPPIKIGASVFLFFTFLATLGRGEHYLIDLIVAVPFAFGIWSLAGCKWRRASLALTIVMLWCVCLREGLLLSVSAPVIWLLCLLTLAVVAIRDPSSRSQSDEHVSVATDENAFVAADENVLVAAD